MGAADVLGVRTAASAFEANVVMVATASASRSAIASVEAFGEASVRFAERRTRSVVALGADYFEGGVEIEVQFGAILEDHFDVVAAVFVDLDADDSSFASLGEGGIIGLLEVDVLDVDVALVVVLVVGTGSNDDEVEVEIEVEIGAVGESYLDVVAVAVGFEGGYRSFAGLGEGCFAGSGEIGVWRWWFGGAVGHAGADAGPDERRGCGCDGDGRCSVHVFDDADPILSGS